LKGQLLLLIEDSFSVAIWFGSQEIRFSEIMTYEEAIEEIEAITTADIRRVAQTLFLDEKLTLAGVGPWSFGPVLRPPSVLGPEDQGYRTKCPSPWSCGPRTQGTKGPGQVPEDQGPVKVSVEVNQIDTADEQCGAD